MPFSNGYARYDGQLLLSELNSLPRRSASGALLSASISVWKLSEWKTTSAERNRN